MLELIIVALAIVIGYTFFRSQGGDGPGFTFRYSDTPEGRKRRAQGLLMVALVMGVIIFGHARSEYLSLSTFGLIALSALVVVLLSSKKK